jgi:hypothetical protein
MKLTKEELQEKTDFMRLRNLKVKARDKKGLPPRKGYGQMARKEAGKLPTPILAASVTEKADAQIRN